MLKKLFRISPPHTNESPQGEGFYIFACYSQADRQEAFAEIKELRERGYRIRYDDGSVPGGMPDDQTAEAVVGSRYVIAFVSPEAVISRHIYLEVQLALQEEKPFLAVHLKKTVLPPAWKLLLDPKQALFKYEYEGRPEAYQNELEKFLPLSLKRDLPREPYVFVCYSHADREEVHADIRELQSRGHRCWYEDGTARGEMPDDAAGEAVAGCRQCIAYISPEAVTSGHMYLEIQMALQEEKQFLAVYLKRTVLPPAWKLLLGPKQAILKYEHEGDREVYLDKLEKALELSAANDAGETSFVVAEPGQASHEYDVFISYRRRKDDTTARLIRKELKNRGFRVFLDVDDLRTGQFDEALLERIKKAPGFILILSRGSLKRCVSPEDWLRREIACALSSGRTVIPVMMPGFDFPRREELPEELCSLPQHHGIEYSHGYFDAMIDKIVAFLRTRGDQGRSPA